jgi:hypothetical protein
LRKSAFEFQPEKMTQATIKELNFEMLLIWYTASRDTMTKTDYSWLDAFRPLAWAGTLVFFIIVKGLVIAAQKYHHLYDARPIRFWCVPIICTAPLTMGYGLAGIFRRASANRDCAEIANAASGSIAMMTLVAYTTLTTAMALFFL